jgi:hypothetical protein
MTINTGESSAFIYFPDNETNRAFFLSKKLTNPALIN